MQGKKAENTVTIKQTPDTKKGYSPQLSIVSQLKKMSEDTEAMKVSLKSIVDANNIISTTLLSINNLITAAIDTIQGSNKINTKVTTINKAESIDLSKIENYLSRIAKNTAVGSSKKGAAILPDAAGVDKITESIEKLNQSLDKKLNRNLRQFISNIKRFAKMSGDVETLSKSFNPLATAIAGVANQAKAASTAIKDAMKGIVLFSIFLQSPLFLKSTERLTAFFAAMSGKAGKKTKIKQVSKSTSIDFKGLAAAIAVAIIGITGALLLLDKVNWKSALLLLGFIGALSVLFWAMNKKKGGGGNVIKVKGASKSKGFGQEMIMFAGALAILILAVYAIKDIDWSTAWILVAWIGAISLIFVISSLVIGRGKGSKPDGMLGFAFGMAILILAIAAGEELFFGKPGSADKPWYGPWAIIGFIIVMGAALSIGKGSGAAASMKGFSIGIAILVLTIWAWDQLVSSNPDMLKHVWSLVLITLLFTIIFRLASGDSLQDLVFSKQKVQNKKPEKNKILNYAICVAIIVGVVTILIWVLSKINGEGLLLKAAIAVGLVAAFAYAPKFVEKQMKGVKRKQVTEDFILIGVVASVAVGLVLLLSLANGEGLLEKSLVAVGIVIGFAGAIKAVEAIFKGLKRKQAQQNMILVGIVATAGVLIMLALSTVNGDGLVEKALALVGVMLAMALVVKIASKIPKKDAIVGGIIMLIISGILFIAASAMKVLSEVNSEGLLEKALIMAASIGIILAMCVAVGAIACTGIGAVIMGLGVVFMLAISGVALLGATMLKTLGETNSEGLREKVQILVEAMHAIVLGIVDLPINGGKSGLRGAIQAAKTLAKLALIRESLVKIMQAALYGAKALNELGQVSIQPGELKQFTDILINFISEFTANVSEYAAKGVENMSDAVKDMFGVVEIAKSFVDVLIAIQSGHIPQYGVKDGEMVVTGVEKFDILKVSTEAGTILGKTLVNFVNAFQDFEISRKQKKAIEKLNDLLLGEEKDGQRVGGISQIFDAVSNLIGDAEKAKVLSDAGQMTSIANNIGTFVKQIVQVLEDNNLEGGETLQFGQAPKLIMFTNFVNAMANADWNKIQKGTTNVANGINKLVTSVNKLQINKAVTLGKTLDSFHRLSNLKKVDEQLNKLVIIIEKISKSQDILEQAAIKQQQDSKDANKQRKDLKEAVDKASNGAMTEKWFAENVLNKIAIIQNSVAKLENTLPVNITNTPSVKVVNSNPIKGN